jgi:hypothetical protein
LLILTGYRLGQGFIVSNIFIANENYIGGKHSIENYIGGKHSIKNYISGKHTMPDGGGGNISYRML